MNKENAHLFLPLVQALIAGNEIQHHSILSHWNDMKNPAFAASPEHYRIKPEPLDVNIWVNDETNIPEQLSDFKVGEESEGSSVRLFREVL